jgi:hypothetical protein
MSEDQSNDKILELRVRPEDRRRVLGLLEKNTEYAKDIPPEEIDAIVLEGVREAREEARRTKYP